MSQPSGRSDSGDGDGGDDLTLQEAADLLGVHYMTAYRYVRSGRLNATRVANQWHVPRASLAALRTAHAPGRAKPGAGARRRDYAGEIVTHLVAGDEAESWRLLQEALSSAFVPEQLYLEVLGPALHAIGDGWESGSLSVADEHRASAVVNRLIGRLGPLFTRRGTPRGLLVLGAPAGDRHSLPSALVADPLRGRGFAVADLGADVPPESFAEILTRDDRARAVGIVVSVDFAVEVVASTVAAIRAVSRVPVLVGGCAIPDASDAGEFGADGHSPSAADAVAWFDTTVAADRRRRARRPPAAEDRS